MKANLVRGSVGLSLLLLVLLSVLGGQAACTGTMLKEDSKAAAVFLPAVWSYKVYIVSAASHEKTGNNALASNEIPIDEAKLNELGKEGWELVSSWLEPETSFPNLADPKYTSGIQSNVRPMRAVLLFRRPPQ